MKRLFMSASFIIAIVLSAFSCKCFNAREISTRPFGLKETDYRIVEIEEIPGWKERQLIRE